MPAVFASRTFRAETSEVEGAQICLLVVLQGAVRAERTEAPVVVGACRSLRLGIDVEVEAVVAIGAGLGARVVGALGHAPEVVLVEEFASLALLAQAAQPVLTHETDTAVSWRRNTKGSEYALVV